MDYELAKQLKNEGFPQKGEKYWLKNSTEPDFMNYFSLMFEDDEICLAPTLFELKVALGEDLDSIEERSDLPEEVRWTATMTDSAFERTYSNCVVECCGSAAGATPEEAAARLWLLIVDYHRTRNGWETYSDQY